MPIVEPVARTGVPLAGCVACLTPSTYSATSEPSTVPTTWCQAVVLTAALRTATSPPVMPTSQRRVGVRAEVPAVRGRRAAGGAAVADERVRARAVEAHPRLDAERAGELRASAHGDDAAAGEAGGGVGVAAERAVGAERDAARDAVRDGGHGARRGRAKRVAEAPVCGEVGRRPDGVGVPGGLSRSRRGAKRQRDEAREHDGGAAHQRTTRSQSRATRSLRRA